MNDMLRESEVLPKRPTSGLDFPVVGLGASAGGLRALITLFEHMTAAPDMSFVVILHLSPKHESNAAAILQNATKMAVKQVQASTPIERNCVYVIPPTHSLAMHDGHLSLGESRTSRGRPMAIDTFFRTLAEAHGERAIGIVLSGTGSDGSMGIARLKETGGVVMAQSPADAEYSGMPDSAISTGHVDIVLPAADIPQRLLELWRNAQQIEMPKPESAGLQVHPASSVDEAEDALRNIMSLLRKRTGHDFKHYKRATVLRRIERRLQVNGVSSLPAYLDFLNAHSAEAKFLLDDMLIGVTNFFRDRPAFEALERDVIPTLFAESSGEHEQVRAWVPGCSSGEEAYTLAVLLCDARSRAERTREIQIFASDIDEDALAIGRQGRYPDSIVADMPPAYLRQYFSKEVNGYRVNEAVRKTVLFANQDILRDPPFSRLDLVSCRNLLIYLNRDAQRDILQMFHFALRPGGYLLLGTSETADAAMNLFSIVDRQHRIYRSKLGRRSARSLPVFPLGGLEHAAPTMKADGAGRRRVAGVAELHQQLLLEEYAPASVVIN
ncbi:MAG: CheR family methyltransferase, partial [Caldimonas sp.]